MNYKVELQVHGTYNTQQGLRFTVIKAWPGRYINSYRIILHGKGGLKTKHFLRCPTDSHSLSAILDTKRMFQNGTHPALALPHLVLRLPVKEIPEHRGILIPVDLDHSVADDGVMLASMTLYNDAFRILCRESVRGYRQLNDCVDVFREIIEAVSSLHDRRILMRCIDVSEIVIFVETGSPGLLCERICSMDHTRELTHHSPEACDMDLGRACYEIERELDQLARKLGSRLVLPAHTKLRLTSECYSDMGDKYSLLRIFIYMINSFSETGNNVDIHAFNTTFPNNNLLEKLLQEMKRGPPPNIIPAWISIIDKRVEDIWTSYEKLDQMEGVTIYRKVPPQLSKILKLTFEAYVANGSLSTLRKRLWLGVAPRVLVVPRRIIGLEADTQSQPQAVSNPASHHPHSYPMPSSSGVSSSQETSSPGQQINESNGRPAARPMPNSSIPGPSITSASSRSHQTTQHELPPDTVATPNTQSIGGQVQTGDMDVDPVVLGDGSRGRPSNKTPRGTHTGSGLKITDLHIPSKFTLTPGGRPYFRVPKMMASTQIWEKRTLNGTETKYKKSIQLVCSCLWQAPLENKYDVLTHYGISDKGRADSNKVEYCSLLEKYTGPITEAVKSADFEHVKIMEDRESQFLLQNSKRIITPFEAEDGANRLDTTGMKEYKPSFWQSRK